MSARSEALAREKESLLARSALCRLRLRMRTRNLRDSLPWMRAVPAPVGSNEVRRTAFGLAVSFIGFDRSARMIVLAGRIVLLAALARSVIVHLGRRVA